MVSNALRKSKTHSDSKARANNIGLNLDDKLSEIRSYKYFLVRLRTGSNRADIVFEVILEM